MADWTKQNTLKLIEIYRNYEIIWDPKNKNHFNKILKNDAWNDISTELSQHVSTQISAEECKKKMISLLAAFRREKTKIRKSKGTGSGTGDVYKSSWFAFDSLEFLTNRDTPRETKCTMAEDKSETFTEEIIHTIENPVPTSFYSTNSSSSNKRKNNNEDRLEKAFKILETAQAANNNECQAFGLFVANKLQNYNQQVRNIVQHEISNVLFHADNEYYTPRPLYQNSPNQTTPSTNTQSFTPVPSPANTFTSEELDFTDLI